MEFASKDVNLVDLPKWFKFQLTFNFSKLQGQELPEGPEEWRHDIVEFFTKPAVRYLKTIFNITTRKHQNRRHILLWNLLQCKTVSNTVPKCFIELAYKKHAETMGKTSPTVNSELLSEFRNFIQPLISETVKRFSNKTNYPSNHATFGAARHEGGLRSQILSLIDNKAYLNDWPGERIDPIVIHLTGAPGLGKSYMIEQICKELGTYFGLCTKDYLSYTFYRSAATKHWDGYRNQLISIIDDIGFEAPQKDSISDSLSELIQLCSDCQYTVPMADLREKGRKFTSKFLIITSNLLGNHTYNSAFADPRALHRRISPAYVFTGKNRSAHINGFKFIMCSSQCPTLSLSHETEGAPLNNGPWQKFETNSNVKSICVDAICRYQQRMEKDHLKTYTQIIQKADTDVGYAIHWNRNIPDGDALPLNEVKTHAIAEPLKVRMITKPQAHAYALKPVQKAMFTALSKYKCFEPCSNPNYDLTNLGEIDEAKILLSGDYTNATDDLNFNISQIAIEELSKAFESSPFLSSLIKWEGGEHLVHYPEWTGLSPVLQSNGQLMGSLLSFPILCWVNAFTLCKATGKNLEEVPALFHGDDIAAQITLEEFHEWKQIASQVGLSLSVGKNYVSKNFISIDSQLFTVQETSKKMKSLIKQTTGKFRLVRRTDDNEMTVVEALKNGFTKELIRKYNSQQLAKSIRSLEVGVEYGGLGLETNSDRPYTLYDRLIYYTMLKNMFKVESLGNNLYRVNKRIAKFLKLKEINIPFYEDRPVSENLLKKKVRGLVYKVNQDSLLYKNVMSKDMTIPLSTFKEKTVVRYVNCSPLDLEAFSLSTVCIGKSSRIKTFEKVKRIRGLDSTIHRRMTKIPKGIYYSKVSSQSITKN